LAPEVVEEIKRQTRQLALALNVKGLMNVQFAIVGNKSGTGSKPDIDLSAAAAAALPTVYVLEVNPRASRTTPFVSKATGVPLARLATLIMIGKTLDELNVHKEVTPKHYSVKESVFPFNKFAGVDIILGPEMRSTGEVMGIADTMSAAFAKAQLAASAALPKTGTVFLSVANRDKPDAVTMGRALAEMGYKIIATRGTAAVLRKAHVPVTEIRKVQEGRPNLVDYMKNGQVALIINTPSGKGARTDEGRIRAAAVQHGVTCITTMTDARLCKCRERRVASIIDVTAVGSNSGTFGWSTAAHRRGRSQSQAGQADRHRIVS
jgi:carbamoyl-phosphate synthase large subunit